MFGAGTHRSGGERGVSLYQQTHAVRVRRPGKCVPTLITYERQGMAMSSVDAQTRSITGGVDTHRDFHVVAALDGIGGLLGTESFATTPAGYKQLHSWLCRHGELVRVGVEGTGSYGAGLTRYLMTHRIDVAEVCRPNRQMRRRRGKSDPVDAVAAARAALAGEVSVPKTRSGNVEAIRALMVARRSARSQIIEARCQLRHLVFCAPDDIREGFDRPELVKGFV